LPSARPGGRRSLRARRRARAPARDPGRGSTPARGDHPGPRPRSCSPERRAIVVGLQALAFPLPPLVERDVEQGLPEAAGAGQVVSGELDQVEWHGGRRYGVAPRHASSGREVTPLTITVRRSADGSTPRAPIRVVVADDQRIFASMLGPVLARDQRVEVVGQATNGPGWCAGSGGSEGTRSRARGLRGAWNPARRCSVWAGSLLIPDTTLR
jgi:hypothetical protein